MSGPESVGFGRWGGTMHRGACQRVPRGVVIEDSGGPGITSPGLSRRPALGPAATRPVARWWRVGQRCCLPSLLSARTGTQIRDPQQTAEWMTGVKGRDLLLATAVLDGRKGDTESSRTSILGSRNNLVSRK